MQLVCFLLFLGVPMKGGLMWLLCFLPTREDRDHLATFFLPSSASGSPIKGGHKMAT